jgi:hypothetical protein
MIKKVLIIAGLTVASMGFAGTAMADPGDNGKANGVRGRECGQAFGFSTVGLGLQFTQQLNGNNAGGRPGGARRVPVPLTNRSS